MTGRRTSGEAGFTMVEVLVALTVSSVSALLIAAAFGVASRTYHSTTDRIAGAASVGSLTRYLPPDVHSALDAVASPTGAAIACVGVSNPRLELVGADGFHVVYGVGRSGAEWVLERHECTGGAATTSTVVARHLAGADAVVPTRSGVNGTFAGASLEVRGGGADPFVVTVSGASRLS